MGSGRERRKGKERVIPVLAFPHFMPCTLHSVEMDGVCTVDVESTVVGQNSDYSQADRVDLLHVCLCVCVNVCLSVCVCLSESSTTRRMAGRHYACCLVRAHTSSDQFPAAALSSTRKFHSISSSSSARWLRTCRYGRPAIVL